MLLITPTSQFLTPLSSLHLTWHVNFSTNERNHTLELVTTSSDTSLARSLSTVTSPSYHLAVFTKLSIEPTPSIPPTFYSFRRLHSIDTNSFLDDLKSSPLTTNTPESSGSLLIAYNTTLSSLFDKKTCSYLSLNYLNGNPAPILGSLLLRSTVRHAENLWKRTHSVLDWSSSKSIRNQYHKLILTSKKQYFFNLVSSFSDNTKRLWQAVET